MPFGTWWRGDVLPNLTLLPTFSANASTDISLIAHLANLSEQEVHRRMQRGNRAYVAFMDGTPTAYGWAATRVSGIKELQFSFNIPSDNLYLWDFLTLPEWRGKGIYPHLLQAIIEQEHATQRFWIGYAPGNETSAHSIKKAGFHVVCDFVVSNDRISGLELYDRGEQAQASADFFKLPVIAEPRRD